MDALPGTWPALALLLLGLLVGGLALGLLAVAGLRRLRRSGDMVITFRPEDPRSRRRTPRLRRLAPEESQRDGLTGLRARSVLAGDGATLLAEAVAQGRRVGLLLFDLDGFKRVNDTLGHHSGDRVLAEVGRRTQELVDASDVAVRLGGDEFALLVTADDAAGLDRRAEQLLEVLARPVQLEEVSLSVRPSLGLAEHPADGESVEELLRAADSAMYDAKESGARWRRASEPTHGPLLPGTGPDDLAAALERHEVVVHYQPQVDGWSGAVTGFEALVRWQHPEHGLLLPEAFLPRAERSAVIAPLTQHVLQRALAELPALQTSAPGATVAVNVSARSLLGHRLLEDLERLVAASRAHASDLVLEITEPAPRATAEVRGLLDGLRRLGCRVSVHGFGSAQTSLTALWHYPAVREIKIDPSIIRQVATDPEAERLCRAMISAARGLDVRVVAEGVESSDTVHRLRAMGCDAFQGYFLGHPVPLDEVPAWTRDWHRSSATLLGR